MTTSLPGFAVAPAEAPAIVPVPAPSVVPRVLVPGCVLLNRYEIQAALGQGGMGVVYRAHDRQANRPVAVKAFFMPGGAEEGTRRFQREFRALTRLQHPHIVRVFDYGEADGTSFYVMEFISGSDLAAVRRARGGRLSVREALTVGIQLCEALSYVHAQGIVHRDLKPSNVMAAEDDTTPDRATTSHARLNLKLVDFGLAKLSDVSANLTASGLVLGTINYMSPEQVQALPIDARSDLYSLGVLLFELVAGQLPFSADAPTAIMLQHIFQSPPLLRSFDPSIPVEFQALVNSLLAKQPGERPPSAEVVLSTLTGLTSLTFQTPVEITALPRADTVLRAGLIGRQAELERLNQYLDDAWRGEGQLVIVEGEAGVGKSRLVAELAGQVRLRGGQRLLGTCHEVERIPYGPIAEWFHDAARHATAFSQAIAGVEAEIARLVPQLVTAQAAPAASEIDPQQAKLRFFDAVLRTLTRLSVQQPLLLVFDDLQWADEASLELLHYLTRNVRGQRLFICATLRREDRDQPGLQAKLLRDLSRLRLLERLELDRLTQAATLDLVAALLGLPEAPRLLVERIYQESEGNPFFVEELLKALAEEGLLVRQSGHWQLQAEAGLTMLHIPSTISDVIERRLARLNEAERGALNWGAVLGYEFAYDILQPASGLAEDDLLDLLDSLLRAQLLMEVRDPRQDKYRFTHAKIREVVYGTLSGARRKKMHRSAGDAIEKLYPARLAEMSPLMAHHYTQGGDAPKAIRYSVQAGDRARHVYANQEAIALYRQALALAAERADGAAEIDRVIEARRGLGEVYQLIGEYPEAVASYQALIDLASQSDRAEADRRQLIAQAWWGIGQAREATGEYGAALHAYDAGVACLAAADHVERARLLNEMAWVHIRQGDYARARAQCERAIELAEARPEIVATAHEYLGTAARNQQDYDAASFHYQQGLQIWERAGDKAHTARVLNRLATLGIERQHYDEALDYSQRSLLLCREIGLTLGTASVLNNLGIIYQARGQFDLARDHFQQGLVLYQRLGSKDGIATAYCNLGEVCLAEGKSQDAVSYLQQAQALAEEIGFTWLMAYMQPLLTQLREAPHEHLAAS